MVCCNHSAVGVDVLQLILIAKNTHSVYNQLLLDRCMLPSSTQYLFWQSASTYCNYCNQLVRPTFNCMLANLSLHVPLRCHGHKLNDCSHLVLAVCLHHAITITSSYVRASIICTLTCCCMYHRTLLSLQVG